MEVLQRIQEYIAGEEIQNETRNRLKLIHGDNFTEDMVKEETDAVTQYFKKDDYQTLFVDFELLLSVFEDLKLNYRESAKVLAFILNENAKFIKGLNDRELYSYAFVSRIDAFFDVNNVRKYQNLLKEYPTMIRKYISDNGDILPVMVTSTDKENLKNMYFNLSDSQIDNILFFCQKKYEKSSKNNAISTSERVDDKVIALSKMTSKDLKKLYKELSKYLNAEWKPFKYLAPEEIAELKAILEKVYVTLSEEEKNSKINAILKLVAKANHNFSVENELENKIKHQEEIEQLKSLVFKEHECITYDIALNIIRRKDFSFPLIQNDLKERIDCIDALLEELLLLDESNAAVREENMILINIYFSELYDILNNYSLIENSVVRKREKQNKLEAN